MPDISALLAAVLAWVGTAFAGAVVWYAQQRAGARIKAKADTTLARFGHELDRAAAAANFDYQRKLQDFNLFIAKKHEVMAELYGLLIRANSEILRAAKGDRTVALLEDQHAEDVETYLRDHANVPTAKRKEILSHWQEDRTQAMKILNDYQESMQPEFARRALDKANNYRLHHELYLPDHIAEAVNDVTKNLYFMHHFIQGDEAVLRTEEFMARLHHVKALMKSALGRSELNDASPVRGGFGASGC